MPISHFLYQLLIGPLEIIFEIVYGYSQNFFNNSGLSIIVLSLTVNTLLLPLYRCADAIQEEAKETENRLAPWVAHIKKTFQGDERFMMLQTYYRQNGYKPFYVLKSSMPLFLEVPFFIAAYHFLSNLEALNGVPFGPIANLGAPDGMLSLSGVTLNLLPIVMTVINCVSSMIYSQGLSLKDKIQLYGMALIFLVLLYESPAGLVFYWTLNNLFSLVKNIFYKIRNPRFVLSVMLSILGIFLFIYGIGFYRTDNWNRRLVFSFVAFMMETPLLLHYFQDKLHPFATFLPKKNNLQFFLSGCVFLALLTGVLIPSAVIVSSPVEFVQIADFYSPLRHILNASCLSIGFFVIWPTIFYCMTNQTIKGLFDLLVLVISGVALVDYMFFGTKLGILSAMLQYETGLNFSFFEKISNSVVIVVLVAGLFFLFRKKKYLVQSTYFVFIISIFGMSLTNLWQIYSEMPKIEYSIQVEVTKQSDTKAHFTLSRQGKNVIVLMLDRAISSYLPYIFQEKPELKRQFAGFIYYPNTISFAGATDGGAPPIYGGYEYIPAEVNNLSDETLADKKNESLKVMPVLFDKADFKVTVCDLPHSTEWLSDLSIYDKFPRIKGYLPERGQFSFSLFSENEQCQQQNQVWERNFFCYSLVKIAPLFMQPKLYQGGTYFKPGLHTVQRIYGISKAVGQNVEFLKSYAVLCSLPTMTRVADNIENTFLLMCNSTTHEAALLQEPEYAFSSVVNNSEYDNQHAERFILHGRQMRVETAWQMQHYHANMAAMIQLGRWMDYLRSQDLYDNTRIIIVADHGRDLGQFDDMKVWKGTDLALDIMMYNPLFLVKDFYSREFITDITFMTNADVPTFAFQGLIADPVNPFTHKPINSNLKHNSKQFILNGTYAVHDNIFSPDNWENVKEQ